MQLHVMDYDGVGKRSWYKKADKKVYPVVTIIINFSKERQETSDTKMFLTSWLRKVAK